MCKLHVIFEQIEFATILQSHDSESLIHMVQQYRLYQPHTSDTKMLQCSRAHPKLLSLIYRIFLCVRFGLLTTVLIVKDIVESVNIPIFTLGKFSSKI